MEDILHLKPSRMLGFQAKDGSGSGSHTHLKKFMRLRSVHWSSFPQLKLVESVGNAPTSTCLQGRCIPCLPRPQREIGKSPWCCPRQTEFWRLCCTSWCATCGN